jgi:hypothetical protein
MIMGISSPVDARNAHDHDAAAGGRAAGWLPLAWSQHGAALSGLESAECGTMLNCGAAVLVRT